MSTTRSDKDYSYKTDFQIWRGNKNFGRQNILMCQPPLVSTTIGANKSNGKTSQLDSIPIRTKAPERMPRTRPTELSKQKGKLYVPADP